MSSRAKQKQANRVVRQQLAAEARRRRMIIVSIIAAVAVVAAGLIGWGVYETQKPDTVTVPQNTSDDHTGFAISQGAVKVDAYIDFLCPHCKEFETSTSATIDDLASKGKITMVYHPIAILDRSSNPAGYSTRAASAAACAADGGKFPDYLTALYQQQPAEGSAGLSDDQLVQIGANLGLIDPTFAKCVRSEKYGAWVASNTDKAFRKGVKATPTVYVAGKQLSQPGPDTLSQAVANAA